MFLAGGLLEDDKSSGKQAEEPKADGNAEEHGRLPEPDHFLLRKNDRSSRDYGAYQGQETEGSEHGCDRRPG